MPFDATPVNPQSDLLDRFDRAYALIEDGRYWCKGSERLVAYYGTHVAVRHCVVGALRTAHAMEVVPLVASHLPRRFGIFKQPLIEEAIVAFNDAALTTHDDVLRLLRKTRAQIAKKAPSSLS